MQSDESVHTVVLDPELCHLRTRLQGALPSSFRVVVAATVRESSCVVTVADPQHLRDVRSANRRALIVVYNTAEADPVGYFDAGADDVVSRCLPDELAARIMAGIRRLGWSSDQPKGSG